MYLNESGKAERLFTVLRDHGPDIWTKVDAKDTWDRHGHEDLDMTFYQISHAVSWLMRQGLVRQVKKRRLFYIVRAVEHERAHLKELELENTRLKLLLKGVDSGV